MRRLALAGSVALALLAGAAVGGEAGPRFRADGVDAEAFGQADGYPICQRLDYVAQERCRIGALSRYDELFPSHVIAAAAAPSPLRYAEAEPEFRYIFSGVRRTLAQYLDSFPVTGFLVAQGDTILIERYQYARTDRHRMAGFSMTKSVVGLLVGIAVAEGAIRSIDEPAEAYVPALAGTEYGRTPIKALLQMASGVAFWENYQNRNSDIAALVLATLGQESGGSLPVLKRLNTRLAPPGERFAYSSAESQVLGLVLRGAIGRSIADYMSEKLWRPLGAEADATWIVDGTGQEVAFAYLNAVLRDWARLGLMLAHGGAWNGRQVVPRDWLAAMTTTGRDAPTPEYGYQIRLPQHLSRRTIAMRGYRGQYVLVDPDARLVLVQTAARGSYGRLMENELFALWQALPR